MQTKRFIIPPGLLPDIQKFEAHHRAAIGEPIMIVGPTGVGKSLFLAIFEKLYKSDHPPNRVVWANCAHFGGADPNLARAELFGQVRGAFTGATDKKGLIEEAAGGALILEEIGELPLEVQAMLLTFIETGQYRKVGATTEKRAQVQIVGATNREEALREDFRYRFFPFYVPALHQRRIDVLYYLTMEFPDLVVSLKSWEVMLLLAHNWPGNVREVLRVGRLIQRDADYERAGKAKQEWPPIPMRFYTIDERQSVLHAFSVVDLYNDLQAHGIDVRLLESLLNAFHLGLSVGNGKPAFRKGLEYFKDGTPEEIKYAISAPNCPAFDEIERGLWLFSSLFWRSHIADSNLLNVKKGPTREGETFSISGRMLSPSYFMNQEPKPRHDKLERALFEYIHDIEIPKSIKKIPLHSDRDAMASFLDSLKRKPCDHESAMGEEPLESMTWQEVDKLYCRKLITSCDGNKSEAARRAGLPKTTFEKRIRKLGIA